MCKNKNLLKKLFFLFFVLSFSESSQALLTKQIYLKHVALAESAFAKPSQVKEIGLKFSKKKYKLSQKIILVEIADTPEKHAQGLMFREHLGENEGMLFIFESEEPRSFWMKNTFLDLSIGYFNKNQELIEIVEMKAVKSLIQKDLPQYPSNSPAQYALEMTSGWFQKNHIKLGQKLSLVK